MILPSKKYDSSICNTSDDWLNKSSDDDCSAAIIIFSYSSFSCFVERKSMDSLLYLAVCKSPEIRLTSAESLK